MSERFRLAVMTVICGGLVVGVGGFIHLGIGRDGPSFPEANGVDRKVPVLRVQSQVVRETGPERTFISGGTEIKVWALREGVPGEEPEYFVNVTWGQMKLALEDVQ